MLEPGTVMLKWIAVLLLAGIVFYLLQWKKIASFAMGLAAFLFALLIILLVIEAHQDKVLFGTGMLDEHE